MARAPSSVTTPATAATAVAPAPLGVAATPGAQRAAPSAPSEVGRALPALVLLATDELAAYQAAVAVAQAHGADVSLAYPPSAFIAHLPGRAETALRGRTGVARIERGPVDPASVTALGGQAETAARAWNAVFHGTSDPIAAAARLPATPPEHDGPDVRFPPPDPPGARAPGAPHVPSSTQPSEFMAGTIAVSVIFVQSGGGVRNRADFPTESWDVGRQSSVLS